jgi:thioredoxin reductase (NADPH)
VTTIETPSINGARAAASEANALATRPARNLPVLFVVDRDPNSLDVLLSDLSRRFGNDFTVRGESSPAAALAVLRELAAAFEPVALLLVAEAAAEFLASAHELHPSAKRVLLVDRDYSSTSPAVQAMTLGRADYHIVRPWADEERMYRAMSEYLASWSSERVPNFEEFRSSPRTVTAERCSCAT